jgi:2',3'-cyclic-nucleotide 2'-phosphodiesterase (5'-nucleotidase family)
VGGVRFGIIGLTYPSSAIIKASAVQGLKFSSGTEAVRKYLPEVRQQSDIVIVLSHLGLASSYPGQDGDTELAMAVPGIDIIVGGHSHVELRNARRVGDALIVQAGSKGKYLGRLELTIDKKTKKIVSAKAQDELMGVVSTKTIPNAAVAQIVQKRLDEAGAIMNRPLGESLVDMTESCYSGECLLGNLIVDAMRAANQAGDRPADVAMHNNAGVRSQINKGPINYGQLYLVLPFDNVLEAVDLTGAQIRLILEKAVSGRPGNMLVSGLTYEFDQSKPIGQRILKVTVGGQPLDPNKVYRVQTIDYLASGGDGQTTFTEGKNPVYGDPTVDVVAEYIRTHSPVSPKVEGRIVGK